MNDKRTEAILLVAGEGTRLRPYTFDRPKCLVEVNGESLLDRQLRVLKSCNVNDVTLVGGYRNDMLSNKNCDLIVNSEYHSSNMVWTLLCAIDEIDKIDCDLIISYGDIVYSKDILLNLINSNKDISVAIDMEWESYWRTRNENPIDDAETLRINSAGEIIEIGQKPLSISEIQGQYMGLIKLSAGGFSVMKKFIKTIIDDNRLLGDSEIRHAYMTDLLQGMISDDIVISSVPIHSVWVEIDTPDDLNSPITASRIRDIDISI
jgi:L-glutamine-phosphate cytidylyltransferase